VAADDWLSPEALALDAFIAPPASVAALAGDPRLTAALEAASASLAPGGKASNAQDRYAASVIETHLSARRRLTQMSNALLKP
jgi:hypothetical protein